MITSELNKIEQGCGSKSWIKHWDSGAGARFCGENKGMILCPTCRAKLSATKSTAKMMIDDEIEFLMSLRDIDIKLFVPLAERLSQLQKQKEDLK